MYSCPTSRSFGPRTTELLLPLLEPFSAGGGVGVGCLLAGRLLLKVTHPYVAVQGCAIVDLQPADLDVAAEPGVPAQCELVPCRHHALDVALQRHVRALEKGLDVRAVGDVDVAAHPNLALDAAIGVDRPVVDE